MPRWEVHISFGLMALVTVFTGMVLGTKGKLTIEGLPSIAAFIGPVLLFGGMAMMIGSVLPDVDGKGRIRWIIGPVAGCMLFVPALYGSLSSGTLRAGMDFVRGEGSFIFLLGTFVSYSSLIVPSKHRGIFHTKRAAVLFGLFWGLYVLLLGGIEPVPSFMIGAMAATGYLWHLALDGEL